LDSSLEKEVYPTLTFSNRMGYFNQLIISKKFKNALSLLFSPIIFYENTVVFDQQENTQYALSLGGRYKVSKRTSINIDYGYHFNRADASIFNNPLGIGVDIETGGHVFQLLFSNSQPMNSINAMTAAAGDWSDGDVYFGFNLFRTF
jgi:predicted porin